MAVIMVVQRASSASCTFRPVSGLCTSKPFPMNMPTCPGVVGDSFGPGMNIRSPGCSSLRLVTAVPALAWSEVVRGRVIPAAR